MAGNRIEIVNLGIVLELLVNVFERGRSLNSMADGEAEAVGLVGSVVWILTNNH